MALSTDEIEAIQGVSKVSRPTSIADHLRRNMDLMTPSERKIARTLLSSYPAVGLSSVADLAQHSSSSPASVIRLVQKLGFGGFLEFQGALLEELTVRRAGPKDRLERSPNHSNFEAAISPLAKGMAETITSITETIPESEFSAAIEILCDLSKRVWLIGGRSSRSWAMLLENYLLRLRPEVALLSNDLNSRSAAIIDASKKSVLVAFDVRRYELDTVHVVKAFKERHAKVLLITDVLLSPAANYADIVLPINVEVPAPFDTAVAGIALVEMLTSAVLSGLGNYGVQRMNLWEESTARGLTD